MSDFHRSLAFVASQHPDLDSGQSELLDALRYIVLKQIFYGRNPYHSQVTLYLLHSRSLEVFLSVGISHSKRENSKAFCGKFVCKGKIRLNTLAV